jgi:predicted MPP superfamily phosphohydrolase
VRIESAGATMRLAGVDDWNVGNPDLDAALAGCARSEPVVLLSHNPDAAVEAARRGVAAVLSGHTHGGQIRIPGLPVLVRMSRFRLDEGRYRIGDTEVVVSRGLGVVGLPVRVACPPEAVLLTLRSSPGPRNSTE